MALTLGRQFANELSTDTVMDGVFKFWVFMAGFLLSAMIWTSTGFGQTALSREQKSFYLFQTLPIDPINHYSGRFMSAFLSTEIFNLALAIVFTIFIKLGIVNGILVFLGLSLGALFATPLSLWIGSNGININWKKPEEVTKGGMKFFITYILSMVFIGLTIGAYVLIINITGSHNIASFVILVVILALTVLASTLAIKAYKKGFYDI